MAQQSGVGQVQLGPIIKGVDKEASRMAELGRAQRKTKSAYYRFGLKSVSVGCDFKLFRSNSRP